MITNIYMFSTLEMPEAPVVPTADEIAAKITIPDVEIPDDPKLKEVWLEIYEDEIEDLERDAERECENEFEWNDVVDLMENAHGDIRNLRFDNYDDDDTDYTIHNLGIDDEDDRSISIEGSFFVEYKAEEGSQDYIRERIYGTCEVTSDDGDLEADLILTV